MEYLIIGGIIIYILIGIITSINWKVVGILLLVAGTGYVITKSIINASERRASDKKKKSEEASKQRAKWADEIREKALRVSNICESNKSSNKPLVSTTYQASSKMKDITKELIQVAELQGKVDAIVNDLVKKGGAGDENS